MGWESCCVVGFDLESPFKGQMRIAKHKSAYNLLIIGPRGLEWSNDGSLALVSCLSRGYKFASVLFVGLVSNLGIRTLLL